jgi:oligosaccharide repeat unit polymerase
LLKTEHALFALSAGIALVSMLSMHYLVSVFRIKQLTVPAAFYWAFFLRVYLPAHSIYLQDAGPIGRQYMIAVMGVLLLVPLGIALAQIVLRRNGHSTRRFFKDSPWPAVPLRGRNVWIWSLLLVSIVVIAFHLRQLPGIPLVQLMTNPGQSALATSLRESAFKTLAVPSWMKYLMTWTRGLFLPVLTMLCWAEFRSSKARKFLVLAVIALLLGLFYSSLTLAKGPVAEFLLVLVVFYVLWYSIKLSPVVVLAGGALVLLFPFLINFVKFGRELAVTDFGNVISSLTTRMFYITAKVPYHYFALFPFQGEFLGGRSIGILSKIMGWEFFNTAGYVYEVTVGYVESGLANAAFIADLYADFGMLGVFLGSCIAGFALWVFQIFLERQPKTTLLMAVYAFACVAVTDLVGTSLFVVLMTGGVAVAMVMLWLAARPSPTQGGRSSSSGQSSVAVRLSGDPYGKEESSQ